MANTSITERMLLTAIVNGETITPEMQEKAQAMLASLEKKNAKRKESGTKTQKENTEIKANIITAIQNNEIETIDGYITAKTTTKYMQSATDNPDFTTQKASALLKQLVESGELEIAEVKTKSGKVKGYKITE